eukprot:4892933-Amphidinium_carterae.1
MDGVGPQTALGEGKPTHGGLWDLDAEISERKKSMLQGAVSTALEEDGKEGQTTAMGLYWVPGRTGKDS